MLDVPSQTPEERKAKMDALRALSKVAMDRKRELKIERLAQFVSANPFFSTSELIKEFRVDKTTLHNIMAMQTFKDKVADYKSEYTNPLISADITERYRTLAMMAIEKAQNRIFAKDCKDQTLVEVLRVCAQVLAPKNSAVQINAGQGSLIGVLSEMQSSAQESLTKIIEGEVVK